MTADRTEHDDLSGWLAEDPARGVPHVDYGTQWVDLNEPDGYRRVSWIPTTGELYATNGITVEVLGCYPSRPDVDEALKGWGSHGDAPLADLAWIRHAVLDQRSPSPNPPGWGTLGGTPGGEPLPAGIVGPHTDPDISDGHATLSNARAAGAPGHHDPAGHSAIGIRTANGYRPDSSLPHWDALANVPPHEPFLTHAEATAARLQAWERNLEAREQLLLVESARLESPSAILATARLPAAPVASALSRLHADRYIGGDDPATFAHGLGIDEPLATAILTGGVTTLDADAIAHVCEALRASPFDIWGAECARGILGVYGPERWPRHIEPLDDGRRLPNDDTFLRRRIEQQAAHILQPAAPVPAPWVALEVTRYQQTGVLAVDAAGNATPVTDTFDSAAPATNYHFTFRELAPPETVDGPLTAAAFAAGCPAGHDAPPALAALAERLDHHQPGTDMFHFRDVASGTEHWLGRDTPFDSWQTWDDPRRYYPGDPSDVLKTTFHAAECPRAAMATQAIADHEDIAAIDF